MGPSSFDQMCFFRRGAHRLCEYRLAPGAILHAGTERAGLKVRYIGSRVLVSDVPPGFALKLQ